jgi:hypothetical protein
MDEGGMRKEPLEASSDLLGSFASSAFGSEEGESDCGCQCKSCGFSVEARETLVTSDKDDNNDDDNDDDDDRQGPEFPGRNIVSAICLSPCFNLGHSIQISRQASAGQ